MISEDGPSSYPKGPRVSTGCRGLDYILDGGIPAGKLYLVQGDPGSGKTTLGLQFLLDGVRCGEPVLYITLSETKAELEATAVSHGWDVSKVHIHEVRTRSETNSSDDYSVFHASEVELSDLLEDLYSQARQIRPKRAVLDSLSEVRILSRDPIRYRRHLLHMRQIFSAMGCTLLLLDASRPSVSELQTNTLPHGVIQLDHSAPLYGLRRRRLIVMKMRGVQFDDGYHDLRIKTGEGVVIYPRLSPPEQLKNDASVEISSGVPDIDKLSGGGLARGSSTVIMGSAGGRQSTPGAQEAAGSPRRGGRAGDYTPPEKQRGGGMGRG